MKQSKIFLFSITALLAFSLACSAVSSFIATPTPVSTSTPLPSPTPEPSTALFKDNFSSTSTGWGTGTDAESSVEYVDGGLQFKVFSDLFVTWSGPDQVKYSDVHIDVTVKNNSTDELALFGIICHEQESQDFYYLGWVAMGIMQSPRVKRTRKMNFMRMGIVQPFPPAMNPLP
jgi:hypothetical protein